MNWIITENNTRINISDIPQTSIEDIRQDFKENGRRITGFFGCREQENINLYVIEADDAAGRLYISSVLFTPDIKSYNSLTQDFPAFHNFEREFFEEFKIEPLNHPQLKPLRKNQDEYPFFEMKGEEIHEVSVGPIHAGIIEPGHFRFQCRGEKVYELEIMLGFQHRGIEKLLAESGYNSRLAESICGDTVIGYNLGYSQIMETLSDTEITDKAQIIRRIALELERTAVHTGDLGAIAGDTAYLQPAAIFGAVRTLVINTLLEISGSRFGRGLIDAGGVNFDINDEMSDKISKMLDEVLETVSETVRIMLKKPSFLSRIEKTGFVSKETADAIGACGMAARASGLMIDSRIDFKDKWYNIVHHRFKASGDVYARFYLRYLEIQQSAEIIKDLLKKLKEHKDENLKVKPEPLIKNSFAVSMTEGWRGGILQCAITDDTGRLKRYKIYDPSFNNWLMLALAVRNSGISDFPLCNKSFNLSYCGHDL